MKNKGFSLVELIIVIAIMAILAAAIAPALIRYIDKSRRADDVTAAGTLETAVVTALANEKVYDAIVTNQTQLVAKVSEGGCLAVEDDSNNVFSSELNSTLPNGAAIKYKKEGASVYSAYTTADGQVAVYIGTDSNDSEWMIRPSRADLYN